MSTQYEVFGKESICKYAGFKSDPAGGYDLVCGQSNIPGILYCHSKCKDYEPRIQKDK